jgi:hypothetical protein
MLVKTLLLSTFIAVITVPAIANAALITTNNSAYDSAVKVTSGAFAGKCTGSLPPPMQQYTPAHSTSTVDWSMVDVLCTGSGNLCSAEIYANINCTGSPIGTAVLDLANQVLTAKSLAANFAITAQGSHVYLDPI